MDVHRLPPGAVAASLHGGEMGLSAAEAARRLAEYGPNALVQPPGRSAVVRFLAQLVHFFALILWVAVVLALVAEHLSPGQGMATLALAVGGVILVNAAFAFWQEQRAARAVASLQALLPPEAMVIRDGRAGRIPATALVPGDVVALAEGDRVPADCRLTEAFDVQVSNATLTGESIPLPRGAEADAAATAVQARNVVLAGTTMVHGQATAVVFATGMQTEFGRVASLAQAANEPATPLQREIARLSRFVAALALGIGVGCVAVGRASGLSWWQSGLFGIGIIVANVPEGLLPTVTLALAMAAQRMARRQVVVRHLPAVEALGATTVIVTDKTGTLTANRMHVHTVVAGGRRWSVAEAGASPGWAEAHARLLECARRCERVREGADGRLVGDPTEVAIVEFARGFPDPGGPGPRLDERPFDAERRRQAVVCGTPDGPVVYVKGAPEAVLPLCAAVDTSHGPQALADAGARALDETQRALAAQGERVMALAWRRLPPGCPRDRYEEALTCAGLIGLDDPPRPEVPAAVARCRSAGIRVVMATGDHPQTAFAIARRVGLDCGTAEVVTGERLRGLSDTQLQLLLDGPVAVFARVGADQKLRIVTALQRKGEVVAVTGDGVNDAAALRAADVGVAMGATGTDVAREAADLVLVDDNFASIVRAVEEGRAVFDNVRKFLTYILTSNVPELVPFVTSVLLRIPLPLTIPQILAVDLGTDLVPALGLGAEPPADDVMARPPRRPSQRLADTHLLLRAYGVLGPLEAAAAMLAYALVLAGGGWSMGVPLAAADPLYREATAACFAAIVVAQVANVLVCRSDTAPAWHRWPNRVMVGGIVLEMAALLAVIYSPAGQALFGTAPLGAATWRAAAAGALTLFVVEELRKAVARRLAQARPALHPGAQAEGEP